MVGSLTYVVQPKEVTCGSLDLREHVMLLSAESHQVHCRGTTTNAPYKLIFVALLPMV